MCALGNNRKLAMRSRVSSKSSSHQFKLAALSVHVIIKGREPDLLESATDDMKSLVEDLPLLLLPSFIWEK
jgi:hypothetical protein